MNIWTIFYGFGLTILASLFVVNRLLEREAYCDHGPSEYDSYCPKCGLDS